jgi:hypothetical protein
MRQRTKVIQHERAKRYFRGLSVLLMLSVCVPTSDSAQPSQSQKTLAVHAIAMERELAVVEAEAPLTLAVKVTVYRHPAGRATASTKPLRPGFYAAVSRSLEARGVRMGDRVRVPGRLSQAQGGDWEIADRTAWWIKGDVLDLSMGRGDKHFAEVQLVTVHR